MTTPRVGQYQACLDDEYIIGYYDTKEDAVQQACTEARVAALKGHDRHSRWYVGVVVYVGTNSENTQHQTSDGTGRMEWGTDHYYAVVTSTVAFGKATYTYNRTPVLNGDAQGRSRA
jgi:hypothetical protein